MQVLYRTAMAILLLFHKHSSANSSEWSAEIQKNGVDLALNKFCREMPVTPQKVLKVQNHQVPSVQRSSSALSASDGFWNKRPQLVVHLASVYQDWDVAEESSSDARLQTAGSIQIERKLAQQPEPEQHPDGLPHVDHPRGEFSPLIFMSARKCVWCNWFECPS